MTEGSYWKSTLTRGFLLGLRRPLREFLDLEHTQQLGLFESVASLLDHFVGQIPAGVMPLRIDSGIKPLLRCPDSFVDAVERGVRIRGQRWLVAFRHGVSS